MSGERLHQLAPLRWLDLDEIVSVRVEDGATAGYELWARVGLRNGDHEVVPIPGTTTQPYNALTQEQSDQARDTWLADHFGDILEGTTR